MGRFFEARKATIMARNKSVSKAFTRVVREITTAVKVGGEDPDTNPALRTVSLSSLTEIGLLAVMNNLALDSLALASDVNVHGDIQDAEVMAMMQDYSPHSVPQDDGGPDGEEGDDGEDRETTVVSVLDINSQDGQRKQNSRLKSYPTDQNELVTD